MRIDGFIGIELLTLEYIEKGKSANRKYQDGCRCSVSNVARTDDAKEKAEAERETVGIVFLHKRGWWIRDKEIPRHGNGIR